GGQGFADVWMRGHFAWEYKGKHRDLNAAYRQLLQYHEDLENPPLLVVCDFERFEVHTKFTATVTRTYAFTLADLVANAPTTPCASRARIWPCWRGRRGWIGPAWSRRSSARSSSAAWTRASDRNSARTTPAARTSS